ncbi:hypothetical protein DH2020_038669 [Rehmannia glutinosa]|uniref:Response regulatory domain-containing protein n=1 Tax=Rehmannia glutinosa TaxID=99300 RepID=A0ABR0UYL2_REHGL
MVHIFEVVIRDRNLQMEKTQIADGQCHELLEIDAHHSGSVSSSDEDTCSNIKNPVQCSTKSNNVNLDGACSSNKVVNEKKCLEGLRILLAEDTPVLQRVATIMLEKMGAKVDVVGDGAQAVDALKDKKIESNEYGDGRSTTDHMPKMDGYEATKAIRRSESGTDLHIPIVALTAHAMSSDEAKCLQVGMDAYLT